MVSCKGSVALSSMRNFGSGIGGGVSLERDAKLETGERVGGGAKERVT